MDAGPARRIPPPPWHIEGGRIYLRELRPADARGPYHDWMNDPEVVRYTESRFQSHSADDLETYIAGKMFDGRNLFLGIVMQNGDRHIGNIKIGPVDWTHNIADLGVIIGEKEVWGQGFATEAIGLVTAYCFETLKLHKITAGCYAPNAGAIRSFEKAGFIVEAVRPEHCWFEGSYVDLVMLGRTNAQGS